MNKLYFTIPANIIDYLKSCIEHKQLIKINLNKQQVQSYSEEPVAGYSCLPLTGHQKKLLETAYTMKNDLNIELNHGQIKMLALDNFNLDYSIDYDMLMGKMTKHRIRKQTELK